MQIENVFSKKQLIFKLVFSSLLLVFLIIFYKAWENWLSLSYFVFAYFLAIFLLFLDEQFLCKFYAEKIESGIKDESHYFALASRNSLFLLALPFLSIFVLTSSGSIFGIAFIMAINFYLLIEMWQLRNEFLLFADRFLAMSKIQSSSKLVHKICWFALAYFAFLLLTLLF